MSQKLLITSRSFGQINEEPMNLLKEAGYDVTFYRDQFNMETFASMIPEYDVLIIGGHKFPAELMEKCPHLKLICKHGAGLDNLDLAKAKELGITVTNAARTNANAVADLAFGMMLNCARKISVAERDVRAGNWHTLIGHDVYQKTLGLIGFGAIARNMARRAAGFSMKVLAYDPFIAEVPEELRDALCGQRRSAPQLRLPVFAPPANRGDPEQHFQDGDGQDAQRCCHYQHLSRRHCQRG